MVLLALALNLVPARAEIDPEVEPEEPKNFQTWQLLHLTVYDDEMIRADIDVSTRWYDDSSRLGVGYVNPQLYWKAQPWLDLGVGYFFAEVQSEADLPYVWEQRTILMGNVQHKPLDWLKLSSRNWFEIRWFESPIPTQERFRLRPQLTFYPQAWGWDTGPLESFYINNEFFLALQGSCYRENRLTPLGLNFRLAESTVLSVFYMLRTDKIPGSDAWEPTHVLGTYLCVKL